MMLNMGRRHALMGLVMMSLVACGGPPAPGKAAKDKAPPKKHAKGEHGHPMPKVTEAVCYLKPTEGSKVSGVVRFTQEGHDVKVMAHVEGLKPDSKHGFHIHEFGDCSAPDGTSAGGHYNPEGHPHGLPPSPMRHAGSFGNLVANAKGVADFEMVDTTISIAGMKNPILGRSVIVHRDADDGGQPTGNAGPRVACGLIGAAKSVAKPKE
ncbi:Superoxide dismutase-like protein YojM precursor [Planctomycetes bacterium Pan216]|uniref:Superoxide dismutase [Cu-Zn] n=1 Tax=Kolteria novifilia TaxID=2527975 RepID=A0A518BCM3_9BACT|nr:Superoxide dismutase-like protein YojM precursor [Planctomycetes bacterium Pan216]